jgi:hypothetical protein
MTWLLLWGRFIAFAAVFAITAALAWGALTDRG